jgi:predicted small lipoprotein YifL
MTRRYTRGMNTSVRFLLAAALLATLVACGNKGPLVKASQATPADAAAAPADASPPSSDPTDVAPVEEATPPPATDPASATPPDVPPVDDGGGNG